MANTNEFRTIINKKKSILENLIDTWQKTSENPCILDEELCFLRSVIGKSQLLLNKKFVFLDNFLQMVDVEKDLNISNNDLQGLWDTICIEIDDLEAKFMYLETIKVNNWKKPTPLLKSLNITKKRNPRKTQKNTPVTAQKELIKSVRSVPTGTTTSKSSSNRPDPSLIRPIEALTGRSTSVRLSGQIGTNTINTTNSRSKSSTAKPSEGLHEPITAFTSNSLPKPSRTKPCETTNRCLDSLTRSGLFETNSEGTTTSFYKPTTTKPCETRSRRSNSSTRSGLLEPHTAGSPASLPKPSTIKSCKTTYKSLYSSTLPGFIEENGTAPNHLINSSSSTRVIPLKFVKHKMLIRTISPQKQIVIAPLTNAKKQIYDKRKLIIDRDKHITWDNEDEFIGAKASMRFN